MVCQLTPFILALLVVAATGQPTPQNNAGLLTHEKTGDQSAARLALERRGLLKSCESPCCPRWRCDDPTCTCCCLNKAIDDNLTATRAAIATSGDETAAGSLERNALRSKDLVPGRRSSVTVGTAAGLSTDHDDMGDMEDMDKSTTNDLGHWVGSVPAAAGDAAGLSSYVPKGQGHRRLLQM